MNTFHGCTALITGASSGIGRELARQLAPQAGALILVGRRLDRLESLRQEVTRPGLEVHCHCVDVADEAQLDALVDLVAGSGLKVDLLINSAGVGDHGLFEESEWARVKGMIEVNIRALTRLTHALLPQLVRRGGGAILNVSSIASYLPIPGMAVYSATKAYVTSFSEALRGELRGTGISVTALCPGPVDTEFYDIAERPEATEPGPAPEIFKVPVEQVAREALEAVLRDRPRVVPGWFVWSVMTFVSLLPIFLLRLFINRRRR